MTTDVRKSKEAVNTFQLLAELDSTIEAKSVKRNDIVSTKVVCWDKKREGLVVIFGNNVPGFIPHEHISIYPSYNRNGVPSEATYIIGKTIIAEVIGFNNKKAEFILSRLNLMKKRCEEIKVDDEITVCVTKVRKKDIFVDVGFGVVGRVNCEEISSCYVDDMEYFGYYEGCLIKLKVIDIIGNKVDLSRKRLYTKNCISNLNYGDVVDVRILSELTSYEATKNYLYAYCVEGVENPNLKGILDSDIELSKGVIVSVKIKSVTPRGLRLRLAAI